MIKYKWSKSLLYPFPVNEDNPQFYLGAAHGLIGTIYMLLSIVKFFPELLNKEKSINSTKIKISKILLDKFKVSKYLPQEISLMI